MDTPVDIKTLPFLALLNAAPIGVICADRVGNILFWNTGAAKIFGYAESEAIGLSLSMLIPERYKEEHNRSFESLANTVMSHPENIAVITSKIIGNVAQLHGLRKDNTEFPCEISVVVYGINGGVIFMGFISDVTGALTLNLIKSLVDSYKINDAQGSQGMFGPQGELPQTAIV